MLPMFPVKKTKKKYEKQSKCKTSIIFKKIFHGKTATHNHIIAIFLNHYPCHSLNSEAPKRRLLGRIGKNLQREKHPLRFYFDKLRIRRKRPALRPCQEFCANNFNSKPELRLSP